MAIPFISRLHLYCPYPPLPKPLPFLLVFKASAAGLNQSECSMSPDIGRSLEYLALSLSFSFLIPESFLRLLTLALRKNCSSFSLALVPLVYNIIDHVFDHVCSSSRPRIKFLLRQFTYPI